MDAPRSRALLHPTLLRPPAVHDSHSTLLPPSTHPYRGPGGDALTIKRPPPYDFPIVPSWSLSSCSLRVLSHACAPRLGAEQLALRSNVPRLDNATTRTCSKTASSETHRPSNAQRHERKPTTSVHPKCLPAITLLSFDLWRNYYIKNVVLFEENSILPLPWRLLESSLSGVKSPKKVRKIGKSEEQKRPINSLEGP